MQQNDGGQCHWYNELCSPSGNSNTKFLQNKISALIIAGKLLRVKD
jgi:hypothetical protein